MDDSQRMSYYSSGEYLHRLYLDQNPLIQNVGAIDESGAKKILEEQITKLRQEEDMVLTALAKAYQWGDTPEAGIDFLNTIVNDSSNLLDKIVDIVKGTYSEENSKYMFEDPEVQNRIIQSTIDTMYGKTSSNVEKELHTKAGQALAKELENDLKNMSFVDRNGKAFYSSALEGFLMERVITSKFNYEFAKQLKSNGGKFNDWLKRNVEAIYTGDDPLKSANVTAGKKQPFDVLVKIGDIDLPIQIKAKPKSGQPDITLYTKMQVANLVNNALNQSQIAALKTALINQHYWAQGAYRKKVQQIIKETGYQPNYVLKGAHPTAIERLDENSTINILEPVIPLMRYAIYYNLITGVHNKVDQLIYLVVGREFRTNSAVLRSSDMLKQLLLKPEVLTTKGHTKVDGGSMIDGGILTALNSGIPRDRWFARTSGVVGQIMNKARITATFNYADLNK